ncbi:hypothetical protein C8R44DRAFT_755212 [Mycena epipterygia]|nr:hypothetical protein C8R44DRAFT_755212 [Mycena epipterygia]
MSGELPSTRLLSLCLQLPRRPSESSNMAWATYAARPITRVFLIMVATLAHHNSPASTTQPKFESFIPIYATSWLGPPRQIPGPTLTLIRTIPSIDVSHRIFMSCQKQSLPVPYLLAGTYAESQRSTLTNFDPDDTARNETVFFYELFPLQYQPRIPSSNSLFCSLCHHRLIYSDIRGASSSQPSHFKLDRNRWRESRTAWASERYSALQYENNFALEYGGSCSRAGGGGRRKSNVNAYSQSAQQHKPDGNSSDLP